MVLVIARQGSWTEWLYIHSQKEWQPKRKMQLTHSKGMLKSRDVADEDYEVRTTVKPQIRVVVKGVLRNLMIAFRFYSQILFAITVEGGPRK
jgi:hypothetical protein